MPEYVRAVWNEVSPDFVRNKYDGAVAFKLMRVANTPRAIRCFSNECRGLSDYAYWFFLGTLWVSYSGFSDLKLWRRLFSSDRPNRATSLMKPSELKLFNALPDPVTAYRAPRAGETDWIALTISSDEAVRFAGQRDGDCVDVYDVPKSAVIALFTRRGEWEIIVLDRTAPTPKGSIPVIRVS